MVVSGKTASIHQTCIGSGSLGENGVHTVPALYRIRQLFQMMPWVYGQSILTTSLEITRYPEIFHQTKHNQELRNVLLAVWKEYLYLIFILMQTLQERIPDAVQCLEKVKNIIRICRDRLPIEEWHWTASGIRSCNVCIKNEKKIHNTHFNVMILESVSFISLCHCYCYCLCHMYVMNPFVFFRLP